MNCEEALKKLYDIIDKEASQVDIEQVQEHLKNCQHCMSRYQFEEMFKAFVIEKAPSSSKNEKLKSSIMERIERTEKSPRWRFGNPFRFGAVLAASAAALVICIVAAFSLAEIYRHKVYTYPFEKEHMSRQEVSNISQASFGELLSAREYVTNDAHYMSGSDVPGFELVHAGFDEILGNRYVHLRYTGGGGDISLFIGKDADVNLPDFERKVKEGTEYFHHVCRECQVIYWISGQAIAIVVTENKDLDLTQFIPPDESV
nr:zf-HC2 domain-containing protein [candidate division Zixibacteria bacterium]